VLADPWRLAALLAAALSGDGPRRVAPWRRALEEAEERAWVCAAGRVEAAALTEGAVARRVVDALPEGALLMIGNSNPVRDLDTYCPPSARPLAVLHQRGASGIDGLVAGAAGAKSVAARPVALLLGDVSLAHDIGGLALTRDVPGPLLIVVVENGGGRIFEQLPLGRRRELAGVLESHFVTPPGLDLAKAAALFNLEHHRVSEAAALSSALSGALSRGAHALIEAVVPRDGVKQRAALWRDVAAALATPGGAP